FAIAITLLIIEIKFPEVPKGIHGSELFKLFQPTIMQFITFLISFLIIGSFWSRHLKLCRYLKAYDQKLIQYNLLFLFFVVTFPFVASGISHFSPSLHMPM
ncbi:TMEM175 family protein, partial [Enterococcus faecium]|uniref:TMEM175 family protein n=1 Tax=Enterococcus faecium TaxID=1352 RepID=UPI003F8B2953